eukprot:CAMPEP_0174852544 /NCGR_PEP_ID=MMETSP1114-20130205/25785_1 /TAXON_ID=312471 /ORGANISM="Neobodo designis, Strain CCAP 1951/1" /LENGTH=130 /DNA_ID=CAMNT_0016087149 /DNA_START=63 /DNA_END=455 /DNA_ORIENTATION=-
MRIEELGAPSDRKSRLRRTVVVLFFFVLFVALFVFLVAVAPAALPAHGGDVARLVQLPSVDLAAVALVEHEQHGKGGEEQHEGDRQNHDAGDVRPGVEPDVVPRELNRPGRHIHDQRRFNAVLRGAVTRQ